MIQESFSVVLNTNATNVSKNGYPYITNDCTFNINWAAIIPEKYRNNVFQLSFTFCNSTTNAVTTPLYVNVNGLSVNNRDQGQNIILGIVKPIFSYSGTQQIMFAGETDNVSITCGYPRSTQIRVYFSQILDGNTPTFGLVNYVMSLSFIPILH